MLIPVKEIAILGVRNRESRRRASFEDLAQIHHCLTLVEPNGGHDRQHVMLFHNRKKSAEIHAIVVD